MQVLTLVLGLLDDRLLYNCLFHILGVEVFRTYRGPIEIHYVGNGDIGHQVGHPEVVVQSRRCAIVAKVIRHRRWWVVGARRVKSARHVHSAHIMQSGWIVEFLPASRLVRGLCQSTRA